MNMIWWIHHHCTSLENEGKKYKNKKKNEIKFSFFYCLRKSCVFVLRIANIFFMSIKYKGTEFLTIADNDGCLRSGV